MAGGVQENLRWEQRTVLQFNWVLVNRIMSPIQTALFMVHAWPSHCDCLALVNAVNNMKSELLVGKFSFFPSKMAFFDHKKWSTNNIMRVFLLVIMSVSHHLSVFTCQGCTGSHHVQSSQVPYLASLLQLPCPGDAVNIIKSQLLRGILHSSAFISMPR